MSIVPMLGMTAVGRLRDKAEVLANLQAEGCLHLVPLQDVPPEAQPAAADAKRARDAFRFLKETPVRRRQVHRVDDFDVDRLIEEVLHVRQRLREVTDRRTAIQTRIRLLAPFGNVSFPPLQDLAGRRLWFYVLPVKARPVLQRIEPPWQIVNRDNTRLFVVVISPEEPEPGLLPVGRSHVGSRSLSELEQELEDVEIELESLAGERQALTRFLYLLGANLARAEDLAELRRAGSMTRDEPELFAVRAWVPEADAPAVVALAEARGLALVLERPAPDDQPPTLLADPEPFAGASDLTLFYTTPGYRTWDPSLIVFASFALFFAMILSDAGYALLLGVLLAWTWPRLGRSRTAARLRPIALVLVGLSFVWGILVGSFFGLAPPEGHPLATLDLIDLDDFDAMMRLSVVIGVLHIVLANAMVAWRARGGAAMLPPLGWIAGVTGGLLVWLAGDGAGMRPGWFLVAAGLALVFAGEGLVRPVLRPVDWGLRLMDGLIGLTRVTRIFGDVLSYLRLFALGLASASLAVTFNQLAGDLQAAVPGLGLALSLLALLLGHAINLALAVMSGVVHGLRLNFIEFFSWGLSGEGYPFEAFRRREVEL